MLQFAYPWVLYWGAGALLVYLAVRILVRRYTVYYFPTVHTFKKAMGDAIRYTAWSWYVRNGVRLAGICLLLVALARPRIPDENSAVTVEGRDIVLTLDVSGSMQLFDDFTDRRSRWQVAQEEARRFIQHRTYDPIGLVYFGAFALSRCPSTLDKSLLDTIVKDTRIGDINPSGTVLSQAIALAVQRLRYAASENKIIILLTDGYPSENDLSAEHAIALAQKAGIKIYAIGVGSSQGGYFMDPLMGVRQAPGSVDFKLLEHIAQATGGASFRASNPQEVRQVYDRIDMLETSKHDAPMYHRYTELFIPCLWIAFALLCLELGITTFVWTIL